MCVIHSHVRSYILLFLQNVETNRERLLVLNITRFHGPTPSKSVLESKMESDAACIQAKCFINHPAFSTTTVLHKYS